MSPKNNLLTFAGRLRQLADLISQDVSRIYRDNGTDFEPRWFPIFEHLSTNGPSGVTDVARAIGVSHPSVNQLASEMIDAGILATYRDSRDKRRRVLALTLVGKAINVELDEVWKDLDQCLKEVVSEGGLDIDTLDSLQRSLSRKTVYERYHQQSRIRIVTYDASYRGAFASLNEAWITSLFQIEAADRQVLADPEASILNPGGQILFAIDRSSEEVLGTCALVRKTEQLCELAKMAVTPPAQGRGIGRRLGEAVLSLAREMNFQQMFLETNSRLAPALSVYRRLGFVQQPFPVESDYARADVYMVCDLANGPKKLLGTRTTGLK